MRRCRIFRDWNIVQDAINTYACEFGPQDEDRDIQISPGYAPAAYWDTWHLVLWSRGTIMIAEDETRTFLGYIVGHIEKRRLYLHKLGFTSPTGKSEMLYVHCERRRRGVGQQLHRALLDFFASRGQKVIKA